MKSSLHAGDRWRDWQNDVSLVANIEHGLLANTLLYTVYLDLLEFTLRSGVCMNLARVIKLSLSLSTFI